jgi:hypothetical protein
MRKTIVIVLILLTVILFACEKEPEARNTVFNFVKELYSEREIDLEKYLDLNELVFENDSNVYIYDSSLNISGNLANFTELFKPDGGVRRLWTSRSIVVGSAVYSKDSIQMGDTAYVEITFMDKKTGKYTYNRMGLRKIDGGWVIFAFKLL